VLGQLGNRIQHALRAFTPKQQKAIRDAAQTYRENPDFSVVDVITGMGVGEALVSTLEGKGQPSIVQRTLIRPPSSLLGAASASAREIMMKGSAMGRKYDQGIDNHSAYEILQQRAAKAAAQAQEAAQGTTREQPKARGGRAPQSMADAAVKSLVRSMSSSVGRTIARELVRGVLGALKR
jgi:hypothetical protein